MRTKRNLSVYFILRKPWWKKEASIEVKLKEVCGRTVEDILAPLEAIIELRKEGLEVMAIRAVEDDQPEHKEHEYRIE